VSVSPWSLAWCPVLTQSPHPALPWPGKGRTLPPLAPPKATRPPSDAWLSSSCMRVLDVSLPSLPPPLSPPPLPSPSGAIVSDAILPDAAPMPTPAAAASEAATATAPEDVQMVFQEADTEGESLETVAVPASSPPPPPEAAEEEAAEGAAAADAAPVVEMLPPPPPPPPRELKLEPLLIDRLGWNKVASTVIAAQLLAGGSFRTSNRPTLNILHLSPSISEATLKVVLLQHLSL